MRRTVYVMTRVRDKGGTARGPGRPGRSSGGHPVLHAYAGIGGAIRLVAILAAVDESNLEESLSAFRQARAVGAVAKL